MLFPRKTATSDCKASTGFSVDADVVPAVPLFPDMEAPTCSRWPAKTTFLFGDPLLQELIDSRPVQRLRRIGFLGAVDRSQHKNRHNRLDHSVSVARLALLYARIRNLSQHDTRILAVAGLLHDVGHGPLSHTLEPIFKRRFGITHHKVGFKIIRGESPLGREIPDVLTHYGIDPDEVNAMIGGTHDGQHAFVFSSPINIDTIEGITRSRSFFLRRAPQTISAVGIVRAISEADTPPTQKLDSFWRLKHQIYNSIIHHPVGLLYDGLAQAVVTQDIDGFTSNDFLADEQQLRRRKRKLFKLLDCARNSPDALRKTLPDKILSYEINAPVRTFFYNTSVDLKRATDFIRRYRQSTTFRRIQINDLLPTEDSINCHYRATQQEFLASVKPTPSPISKKCAQPLRIDLATMRGF